MRKALAIFLSVIVAILGFIVGVVGSVVLNGNDMMFWILSILCTITFGFGYFYFRKYKEKCKKCGELWSVRFVGKETLTQNAISETKKVGSNIEDRNNLIERRPRDNFPIYGRKDVYKTTNYLVGEEKLIYRCDKCGDESSKIKQYKRVA